LWADDAKNVGERGGVSVGRMSDEGRREGGKAYLCERRKTLADLGPLRLLLDIGEHGDPPTEKLEHDDDMLELEAPDRSPPLAIVGPDEAGRGQLAEDELGRHRRAGMLALGERRRWGGEVEDGREEAGEARGGQASRVRRVRDELEDRLPVGRLEQTAKVLRPAYRGRPVDGGGDVARGRRLLGGGGRGGGRSCRVERSEHLGRLVLCEHDLSNPAARPVEADLADPNAPFVGLPPDEGHLAQGERAGEGEGRRGEGWRSDDGGVGWREEVQLGRRQEEGVRAQGGQGVRRGRPERKRSREGCERRERNCVQVRAVGYERGI